MLNNPLNEKEPNISFLSSSNVKYLNNHHPEASQKSHRAAPKSKVYLQAKTN